MSFQRKFLLILSRYFYRLFLFTGLTLLAALWVFGNQNTIKTTLKETNIYSRIADSVVNTAQSEASTENAVPFQNPEVQKIIRSNISPLQIQSQTEEVIDSLYAWLNGNTVTPEFQIDQGKTKQHIAADLSNYATARLESLPVCRSIPPEQNVFELTCRPPGVNASLEKAKLEQAITQNQSVFADETLDVNDLVNDPNGRSFQQIYGDVPTYFRWLKMAPNILLYICVGLSAAIIYINKNRFSGIRTVGWSMLGVGFALAVAPLLYGLLSGRIRSQVSQFAEGETGAIAADVLMTLYGEFNSMLLRIAIITAVAGALIAGSAYYVERRSHPAMP